MTDLQKIDRLPAVPEEGQPPALADVGGLLRLAIEKGISAEQLEKIVALHERVADRLAAQEFARARSAFQAECPLIRKTVTAEIVSQRAGTKHTYSYAPLEEIAAVIRPVLERHGLSYDWDMTIGTTGLIECTCILRHVNGHETRARFICPTDTPAGMTPQQKSAAALTYARRYSLIQALGLTTCDPDTDGVPPSVQEAEKLSFDQAAHLEQLIEEAGADRKRFAAWMGAENLEDCPASRYAPAVQMLEAKIRRRNAT